MAGKAKADKAAETKTTETAAKPAKETKPKVVREKQNGQTKPGEGTKTRALWDIIDGISADMGEPAPRKVVLERAEKEGFNLAMAASLYAQWRKFHGLTGKKAPGAAKPAEPATETPEAPAAPAAAESGE